MGDDSFLVENILLVDIPYVNDGMVWCINVKVEFVVDVFAVCPSGRESQLGVSTLAARKDGEGEGESLEITVLVLSGMKIF